MQDKTYNINITKVQVWLGIIIAVITILTPMFVVASNIYKVGELDRRVQSLEDNFSTYLAKKSDEDKVLYETLGKLMKGMELLTDGRIK